MSAKGRPAKMTDVAASAAARVMDPMKPEQISALKAPRSLRKEGRFAWDHAIKSLSPARHR